MYQDLDDETEHVSNRDEFREIAQNLEGSRDVGAQLFCALLRSARVDARLVCSLQPLSFNSVPPVQTTTPQTKRTITIEDYEHDRSSKSTDLRRHGNESSEEPEEAFIEGAPVPIKRFGQVVRSRSPALDLGKPPQTPGTC